MTDRVIIRCTIEIAPINLTQLLKTVLACFCSTRLIGNVRDDLGCPEHRNPLQVMVTSIVVIFRIGCSFRIPKS